MRRKILPLSLAALLCGCAAPYTPSIRLALDGPPLAVAMRGEGAAWTGLMDRSCMAGIGGISMRNADGVVCSGEMNRPATDKGRLYVDLACTDGNTVAVVFRNLGPDQGMGLARVNPDDEGGETITLFYHPSPDEAERRLEQVLAEIAAALEQKRKAGASASP